ncbi:MAG: asparaginase [Ruminococcaceae bacterium]|nr:asparaginase [Oscillospiraceae bacterium]
MKHILLITTGGTIASAQGENGLTPAIESDRLLSHVPEIAEICRISTVQLYSLDSTNMKPEYWLNIARHIRKVYDDYDGFVITHGTDTMAYASSMLHYLIQNSPKPIVLTGAQLPIELRDTDARENLTDAFLYAVNDTACGINIVFGGKIIAATRAQKTRTKSFNAFSSIDYPDIGFIRSGTVKFYIQNHIVGPVRFYDKIDPSVIVIKLIPGMSADIFDFVAKRYHAVIIESFGVGGLPYYDNDEFAEKIEFLIEHGVRIVITTQVPHEGSDMSVYQVGLRIKQKYEIPEAYDMTTEAVVAKVMWTLPQCTTAAEFKSIFLTPIGNDRI